MSHLFGSYKRSKYVAEHEVLRAAAQGLPVTIVMPTFPLGPRDRAPTPTGASCSTTSTGGSRGMSTPR